ncbi:hypothetical protein MNBD_GAMMA16-1278 [hydrothermal vent metagenome]|uniref:Uncharacterized protein n=1 Tax=hydrothermal vent metagenome TaxID=652676 RepID=A0A3B0ZF74_9ZZZZ
MLKKLSLLILVLIVSLATSNAIAEIYYWTDNNGVSHFSDRKIETRAQSKTLKEPNQYKYKAPPSTPKNKQKMKNKVILYTTSWCPYCKKARQYLTKSRIKFTEYDIEKNRQAQTVKNKLDRQYNRSGVPLLIWGEHVVYGYNSRHYSAIFKTAAQP